MRRLSWKHHQGFARWQSGKIGWPLGHFEGACPVPPFLKRGNTLPASLTFLGPMSTNQGSKLGGIGLGELSFAWAKASPSSNNDNRPYRHGMARVPSELREMGKG